MSRRWFVMRHTFLSAQAVTIARYKLLPHASSVDGCYRNSIAFTYSPPWLFTGSHISRRRLAAPIRLLAALQSLVNGCDGSCQFCLFVVINNTTNISVSTGESIQACLLDSAFENSSCTETDLLYGRANITLSRSVSTAVIHRCSGNSNIAAAAAYGFTLIEDLRFTHLRIHHSSLLLF